MAQDVDAISCADDPSYCPDHGYQAVTQQFPPFTLQSSSIEADTTTALDRDDMTVFSLSFSSLKPSATFQDGGCMNSILSDFEGINEDAMTLSATDDDMSAIHDLDPHVPRRIHFLDDNDSTDSADAPSAKRPRVESNAMEELASPEDDYDPDDSDGEPDGYVVHADKCKRKGDKKRKKTSRRKKKSAGGSKSKGAKRVVTWTDSLTLPPPSLDSLQLLARLSTVSSEQRTVDALGRITRHLVQPPKETLDWDDMSLVGIARRCDTLQDMEGVHDYKLMLSYLQLVITCDG